MCVCVCDDGSISVRFIPLFLVIYIYICIFVSLKRFERSKQVYFVDGYVLSMCNMGICKKVLSLLSMQYYFPS